MKTQEKRLEKEKRLYGTKSCETGGLVTYCLVCENLM